MKGLGSALKAEGAVFYMSEGKGTMAGLIPSMENSLTPKTFESMASKKRLCEALNLFHCSIIT